MNANGRLVFASIVAHVIQDVQMGVQVVAAGHVKYVLFQMTTHNMSK